MTAEQLYTLLLTKRRGLCRVKGCRCEGRSNGKGGFARLCTKHQTRLWRINNPDKAAFIQLRASAKRRKIGFLLTFAEFLSFVSSTSYLDLRGQKRHQYHIDRIDSLGPYSHTNIQLLTCSDNVAKENHERACSRRASFVESKIARYRATRTVTSAVPKPYFDANSFEYLLRSDTLAEDENNPF